MAKNPVVNELSDAAPLIKCGLVMPISKTSSHSADHWADVQALLHRAIKQSGFEPENVWEGDLTDRVSQRIVANIFAHEIAIVDASDANPNVMFELGLRLSSKRPTVVISDNLASLPFDIRDFRAIPYPADLNILGMEKFFSELANALKTKLASYRAGEYEPYLGGVVVEVVQPETKEVSFDSALLDRMDEILRRVSRLEEPKAKYANALARRSYFESPELFASVPLASKPILLKVYARYGVSFTTAEDSDMLYTTIRNKQDLAPSVIREISDIIEASGGIFDAPSGVKERLRF